MLKGGGKKFILVFVIAVFLILLTSPVAIAQFPFPLPGLPGLPGGNSDDAGKDWIQNTADIIDASIHAGNSIYPLIWGTCAIKSIIR
jgi:hypothetical protein